LDAKFDSIAHSVTSMRGSSVYLTGCCIVWVSVLIGTTYRKPGLRSWLMTPVTAFVACITAEILAVLIILALPSHPPRPNPTFLEAVINVVTYTPAGFAFCRFRSAAGGG